MSIEVQIPGFGIANDCNSLKFRFCTALAVVLSGLWELRLITLSGCLHDALWGASVENSLLPVVRLGRDKTISLV
jgi:hypothetical protein